MNELHQQATCQLVEAMARVPVERQSDVAGFVEFMASKSPKPALKVHCPE